MALAMSHERIMTGQACWLLVLVALVVCGPNKFLEHPAHIKVVVRVRSPLGVQHWSKDTIMGMEGKRGGGMVSLVSHAMST